MRSLLRFVIELSSSRSLVNDKPPKRKTNTSFWGFIFWGKVHPTRYTPPMRLRNSPEPLKLTIVGFGDKINRTSTLKMRVIILMLRDMLFFFQIPSMVIMECWNHAIMGKRSGNGIDFNVGSPDIINRPKSAKPIIPIFHYSSTPQ